MGRRQDGPSRTGAKERACLNRYVTDPPAADRPRPVFIATQRFGAPPGRIFRRCSLDPYEYDMGLRSRLEKSAAAELPAKYLLFRGQDTKL
jgi:hypothetical protein